MTAVVGVGTYVVLAVRIVAAVLGVAVGALLTLRRPRPSRRRVSVCRANMPPAGACDRNLPESRP